MPNNKFNVFAYGGDIFKNIHLNSYVFIWNTAAKYLTVSQQLPLRDCFHFKLNNIHAQRFVLLFILCRYSTWLVKGNNSLKKNMFLARNVFERKYYWVQYLSTKGPETQLPALYSYPTLYVVDLLYQLQKNILRCRPAAAFCKSYSKGQ